MGKIHLKPAATDRLALRKIWPDRYLHSQQRDEGKFRELLVRLRKMLGKRE